VTPFELLDWPCPVSNGEVHEELALAFDHGRELRLLVLPACFDEANKLRRQTVEIMRRLDLSGIDSFLPDLPGCNESVAELASLTLADWRGASAAAAAHFRTTHVLALRGGSLVVPDGLPGWQYAPVSGAKILRALLRSRVIAAREAGRVEKLEALRERGRKDGVELAGWHIGGTMFSQVEDAVPGDTLSVIDQTMVGGAGLWLRAEPEEAPEQADALAGVVAIGMTLA
jgi:hypothetical protein